MRDCCEVVGVARRRPQRSVERWARPTKKDELPAPADCESVRVKQKQGGTNALTHT